MFLYFLLEEPSMEAFLEALLPSVLPSNIPYKLIPHQGKQNLQQSIPRKIKAIRVPDAKFIIVHDRDSHDCKILKRKLINLCGTRVDDALIRISCGELESWYLGDLKAVEKCFSLNWGNTVNARKFKEPDRLNNAKQELKRLLPTYQEVSHSKLLGQYMSMHGVENNISESFKIFLSGLNNLVRQQS